MLPSPPFAHLKIKVSAHLDFEMSNITFPTPPFAHLKIKVSAHLDFKMRKVDF